MEVECARCHCRFHTTAEGVSICPSCLDDEFGVASTMRSTDLHRFRAEYVAPKRRQEARAVKMCKSFSSETVYSLMGRVRCILAILLFLVCMFFFLIGDSDTYRTPINLLETSSQRLISFSISVIAVLLLLPSLRRHRFIISSSALAMLVLGWFMPDIWHFRAATEMDVATASELIPNPVAELRNEAVLPEAVIVFYPLRILRFFTKRLHLLLIRFITRSI